MILPAVPAGQTWRNYIYLGTQRVALREYTATASSVYYLLGDHLGSTTVVTDTNGATPITTLYKPWGETRYTSGTLPTDYKYTGQRETVLGLYDYKARFYDPALGRFISPDSIVPGAGNPLAWDRFAYTLNNPIRYTDPSGYWVESALDIAFIAYDIYDISQNGLNWENGLALAADMGSLILPGVTGGGLAVRVITHADDAVDAVRAIDASGDTAQKINQGVNAVQAANQGSDGLSAFSRASEFGIKSYNDLTAAISGTGLEAHHLIEKRFADQLGLDPGDIPSIALTRQEHQAFTNAWRGLIGYSRDNKNLTTLNTTADDVWEATQKIYGTHPELLEEVKKALLR